MTETYTVHGTRDGNVFKAPVEADSKGEACEKFLESVNDEEFEIDAVEAE